MLHCTTWHAISCEIGRVRALHITLPYRLSDMVHVTVTVLWAGAVSVAIIRALTVLWAGVPALALVHFLSCLAHLGHPVKHISFTASKLVRLLIVVA